jgi:hypothetical protein
VLLSNVSLWLGVSTIYWGFSGVMGILLRRAWSSRMNPSIRILAIVHCLLLFLPASILILRHSEWHFMGRIFLISAGFAIAALSATQPNQIPAKFWHRTFGHRYFAGTMALTTLWGLSLTFTTHTLAPSIVAVAASLTGAASWHTASRST